MSRESDVKSVVCVVDDVTSAVAMSVRVEVSVVVAVVWVEVVFVIVVPIGVCRCAIVDDSLTVGPVFVICVCGKFA